jgi:alpha-galactosidase/6-phospho-beta-glucosidase family protein
VTQVAARALLANPLLRRWQHVAALLDDILRENAQLLP